MSNVIINDNHLKDIANTIRSKNETENTYKPSEMAGAINELIRDDYYIDGSISKDVNTDYLLNRLVIRMPYLETSHMTTFSYAFQRCSRLIELQELDAGKITNVTNMFSSCIALEKFGGLKDLGKAYDPTETANYSRYTLNLSTTILDHDSLMNVINDLYDIASLGVQTQSLVLGSKLLARLTPEEIAIATKKGWTVS